MRHHIVINGTELCEFKLSSEADIPWAKFHCGHKDKPSASRDAARLMAALTGANVVIRTGQCPLA